MTAQQVARGSAESEARVGEPIEVILPVALVIGLSPVPVIVVILLLNTPRSLGAGGAFLLGWSLAIAALVMMVATVVDPLDEDQAREPAAWLAMVKLVIGVGVLLLAVREWRGRPRPAEGAKLPAWMAAIDQMTPRRALGLGAALGGANPKHVPLLLAGGVAIGAGDLSIAGGAVATAVFVAVASVPVAAPVLAVLLAPQQASVPLESLRTWLTANNAALMSMLFLIIGVTIIGSGLGDL